MDFLKGLGKLFTGNTIDSQSEIKNPPSKLRGKMIKDYTFQSKIVQFQNPDTELASGLKQNSTRVSIYALQKSILNQESFIAYQNNLANNYNGIYPQYLQHVQSASYIYIVLEQLHLPETVSWMLDDLLNEIQQLSIKSKQKMDINGILVNNKKKLVYFPHYQDLRKVSKIYYNGINKILYAELFCKVFQLPQNNKQKIYDKIIEFAETKQLKNQVLKLLGPSEKINLNNNNKKSNIHQNPKHQQKSAFHKTKLYGNTQQSPQNPSHNQLHYINQANKSLYPDISAEDEEIMKLLSVVKVNPKLFQSDEGSSIRASIRARHQNQEQTKEIKNVIDSATQSMFEINKVVKKSGLKSTFDNKNQKSISENKFEVYCTTYVSIFQHFKRTVKSTLSYYSEGFSGIINAYFITLIGILRRSQLVYKLNYGYDIFEIGCQSINVEFYTSQLKRQLVSQAKILTDLREMIMRCFIPIKTMMILEPFLDDHIQKIDLIKLEDFTFFYMTSLMKSNFQKNVHFINLIECMYIILHRNFEIVHFESDMPRKWDEEFFNLRKCLIQSMIPSWKI